ncbi:MAG: hypothetical protein ACI4V7_09425 [Succinivibrionaceae bacterium]
MSYIENSSGLIPSHPINETNTEYSKNIDYTNNGKDIIINYRVFNTNENPFPSTSDQYMYNRNEPVSQYDTEYHNDYRQRLEWLRTHTESMNMALESALVPSIIDGHSLRENDQYIFNDHPVNIQTLPVVKKVYDITKDEYVIQYNDDNLEVVFRCDMIKFRSDKEKRLCYDKKIHVYTQENDTLSTLVDRINREISRPCKITIIDTVLISLNTDLFVNLVHDRYPTQDTTELYENLTLLKEYVKLLTLDSGLEIDTSVSSTLYNLYQIGWVDAFIPFINGYAISWCGTIISVDNKDTFIILNVKPLLDTHKEINLGKTQLELTYLNIPFKVDYYKAKQAVDNSRYNINSKPIFYFKSDGIMLPDADYKKYRGPVFPALCEFDQIFTDDPCILFEEFEMDENSFSNLSTSNVGVLYNKKFTDMDYRYKIKRFNMLCFEDGRIKDDFDVESHQFNILKISLDNILTSARRFKIFYNTRVVYDQDNVLRIKNINRIWDEFSQYMDEVISNIEIFVKEIYRLYIMDWRSIKGDNWLSDWYENFYNDDYFNDIDWGKPSPRLEIGLVRRQLNNMEEGSTPSDEFIYYENYQTATLLRELAKQIFKNDKSVIQETVDKLIDRAYIANFVSFNNPDQTDIKKYGSPVKKLASENYIVNEWFLRKYVKEMFVYDIENDYLLEDMSLIDDVFDFTYNDYTSYHDNLKSGLDYVLSYDADKLEAGINRGVASITRKGSELNDLVIDGRLVMSRWNRTKRDNYVVIYKNGQLYDKYNTIKYDDISFSIKFDTEEDGTDDNVFEFIFFLNCNDTIMNVNVGNLSIPDKLDGSASTGSNNADGVKSFTNLNNAIFMNTDCFDPEEILLFTTKIPGDIIDINDAKSNGSYLVDTEFKSYKEIDGSDRDYSGVTAILSDDFPINGIYRVTKQGGGEYFAIPCFYGKNEKLIEDRAFINCNNIYMISFDLSGSDLGEKEYSKSGLQEIWFKPNISKDWNKGIESDFFIKYNDGDYVKFKREVD